MDPFKAEEEKKTKLRRNNGQMLNDALSIMLGIKPMMKPLGYQEKFDASDLSKYIQDFSFENCEIRGIAKDGEHDSRDNVSTLTNKEKVQHSIQVVRKMIPRVETLGKVVSLINQQLRDIWRMQLNAQRVLESYERK